MTGASSERTQVVYDHRFSEADAAAKDSVWRAITGYLQRFLPYDGAVMDIGCDRGYFVRHIVATEKWAADLRDVRNHLPSDVEFVQASGLDLDKQVPTDHFGLVFMSNYLEHLSNGDAVIEQLRVAARLLRRGGRVMILQPNIRLLGGAYWDFIDHKTPLTERSLVEAAELADLRTHVLVPRFLPYTTKGALPVTGPLARAYLTFRPAWLLLGKQTLYVGEKP
jgi:SAM-dependent methyltransferase